MNIKRCFFGSQRDHRFLEMRRKHGFKNCYVTNTVKCGVRHGVRHDISEVDNCRKFLEREIELIRPKIVVCVGGNADRTFREDILPKLNNPPEPFKVTHYAAHFNPSDKWNKEFKELRSRLAKMG